jgi:hypothetical protein
MELASYHIKELSFQEVFNIEDYENKDFLNRGRQFSHYYTFDTGTRNTELSSASIS